MSLHLKKTPQEPKSEQMFWRVIFLGKSLNRIYYFVSG